MVVDWLLPALGWLTAVGEWIHAGARHAGSVFAYPIVRGPALIMRQTVAALPLTADLGAGQTEGAVGDGIADLVAHSIAAIVFGALVVVRDPGNTCPIGTGIPASLTVAIETTSQLGL